MLRHFFCPWFGTAYYKLLFFKPLKRPPARYHPTRKCQVKFRPVPIHLSDSISLIFGSNTFIPPVAVKAIHLLRVLLPIRRYSLHSFKKIQLIASQKINKQLTSPVCHKKIKLRFSQNLTRRQDNNTTTGQTKQRKRAVPAEGAPDMKLRK